MSRPTNYIAAALTLLVALDSVRGHGGMLEPPMRSIMWRYGFESPVNYDWNALFCGGRQNFIEHKGQCGFCGDPVQGPFENDKGGVYDTGVIVRHYPAGLKEIEVKVELTAHHKGYFEFKLCANNEGPITQECLNRYPLPIREGYAQGNAMRYAPPVTPKLHELHLALPPGVICDRCVLQWTYTAGNSFGQGESGRSCVGCGYQETFVNCADISIGGTKDQVPVDKGKIQDHGGVVEIGDGPEVTAVLDKAEPGASLGDILRELGVFVPGSQPPPHPHVPEIRRPSIATPMQAVTGDNKPKTTKPVIAVVEKINQPQLPRNPVIPTVDNTKRIIPKPLPRRLNSDMSGRISAEPDLGQILSRQRMGMLGAVGSDFYPTPTHNIDASVPGASEDNTGVNGMMRNGQVEGIDHWHAHPSDPLNQDILKPRGGVREIPIPTSGGFVDNSLVDAVYTLRDEMSRPAPQVDIYGRVRGVTPYGDQVRHDSFQQERERSQHYMEKLKQLGQDIQGSISDYHNKQYRLPANSGIYPPFTDSRSYSFLRDSASYSPLHDQSASHFDNYLHHGSRNSHITDIALEVYAPRRTVFTLPRRITVHSMALARRLVRRYPILHGRVYLSRRAHYKNKYARRRHRYARRHRGI